MIVYNRLYYVDKLFVVSLIEIIVKIRMQSMVLER